MRAVIIRQKQPIRRSNGMRVKFEDNAAILINEANLPIGTDVKGPMAREVVERYMKIAGHSVERVDMTIKQQAQEADASSGSTRRCTRGSTSCTRTSTRR